MPWPASSSPSGPPRNLERGAQPRLSRGPISNPSSTDPALQGAASSIGTGKLMEEDGLQAGERRHLVYGLHLLGWPAQVGRCLGRGLLNQRHGLLFGQKIES